MIIMNKRTNDDNLAEEKKSLRAARRNYFLSSSILGEWQVKLKGCVTSFFSSSNFLFLVFSIKDAAAIFYEETLKVYRHNTLS